MKDVKSVRSATHATIDELYLWWSKATIPTIFRPSVIKKLKNLHYKWLLLKKNKERSSEAQKTRKQDFNNQLHKLFDVAHADALSKMQILENCLFLEDQRGLRRIIIGAENKKFTAKQKRIEQRSMKEEEQKQKAGETSTSQTVYYRPENSRSESNNEASDNYKPSTSTFQLENLTAEKIKMKLQLINADVTSALDRNKTLDREAVRLMILIAAALGHDPAKFPLSRSTIQRARKRTRRGVTDSVRSDFELFLFSRCSLGSKSSCRNAGKKRCRKAACSCIRRWE